MSYSITCLRARWALLALVLLCGSSSAAFAQEAAGVRFIAADDATSPARAAVVPMQDLLHTAQLLPLNDRGAVVEPGNADRQLEQLFDNLERLLQQHDRKLSDVVKLQAYVARGELAAPFRRELAKRFPQQVPPVTFVETPLPDAKAQVACDVVAAAGRGTERVQRLGDAAAVGGRSGAAAALMPAGTHVYISGQAERGDGSLADATRQTMASLGKTLEFLGLERSDVVHVKAFLTPMSDVEAFEREVAAFFGDDPAAPVAVVEWNSSLPVEIEMVVSGRSAHSADGDVEYLTPTGVTASPVFARITRFSAPKIVYLGGIYGEKAGATGAEQVTSIFAQMQATLEAAGSDLRHLAKATYYVATDDSSNQLNELRPRYYDPQRPPAASKAPVAGVAREGADLTVDMIAVPSK